nr:hypothetical protein B0A51_15374 [Rachicladosporium sp. CCFEE 5018]
MAFATKAALARLRAAKIDGRTENVRYRQSQLQYLYRELIALQDELRAAIRKDSSISEAEADVEFAAGMTCVKDAYETLDFDKSLSDEYSVARGQDVTQRRRGVGLVYVKTGIDFPFFSVLAPLAAAVAAGNCVLVQVNADLRCLPGLLKQAIGKAVDPDAIAVIDDDVSDEAHLAEATIVDQKSDPQASLRVNVLASRGRSRVVAVVDRTADVDAAARCLVRARLAYNGRSSYAPDLIIVNEFVKKPFFEAAARHINAYSDAGPSRRATASKQTEACPSSKVVASGDAGLVVDISSRSSPLLQSKISEPALLIIATTSLEDAIDYLTSSLSKSQSSVSETTYLASYIFANPPTAKYLSQFIPSSASFINHIPSDLLIGPAAPYFPQQPLDVTRRYTPEMFSVCSPEIVQTSPPAAKAAFALFGESSGQVQGKEALSAKQLAELAVRPLKPTGQPLQHAKIGFFEQGILIGLGTAATPILLTLGTGLYFGVRALWSSFH